MHLARTTLPALSLLAVASTAQAQTFFPAIDYALPGQPAGLAAGDLNLDGILDVVVCLPEVDEIALLYGLPEGGFAPATTRATGDFPVSVALGDVSGDGRLDIAVACRDSLGFTYFIGKPTGGQFTVGETWSSSGLGSGQEPSAITLSDVDRDGDLDFVVGHRAGAFVSIRLTEFGSPGLPIVTAAVGGAVNNVVAGPLDGDPYPEIVAAATTGGTKILRNQAGAGFVVDNGPASFGGFTEWVDLGDADRDGDLDILWLEDDGIDVCAEVSANDGAGNFGGAEIAIISQTSFRAVAFGLIDPGDALDVVATGPSIFGPATESIEIAFGLEGLDYLPGCSQSNSGGFGGFLLADVNGDGRDDLVSTDVSNRTVDVRISGACGSAPLIAEISPTTAPAVGPFFTPPITLTGCGLGPGVTVTVGGLEAQTIQQACGDELEFFTPLGLPLGPATVEVTGAGGVAQAVLEIVPPDSPVIKLTPDQDLTIGQPATLAVGAAPGDTAVVLVSINNLPTSIPGLVELSIGGAGEWLTVLAALTIPAGEGSAFLPVSTAGLPLGATFYLQAAVLTAPLPTLPLPTSAAIQTTVKL